jgi:hypothetical protein
MNLRSVIELPLAANSRSALALAVRFLGTAEGLPVIHFSFTLQRFRQARWFETGTLQCRSIYSAARIATTALPIH